MGQNLTSVLAWLEERRKTSSMTFRAIELADSKEWQLKGGVLEHKTGGFFSVSGIAATARCDEFGDVSQPIIYQPEIGILGFIVCETPAGYVWLMQAKAEPGNQRLVQLAPTVQATYSNYTRRHGGAKTHYLSCFLDEEPHSSLSDSLQSEQGTRFSGKFNRNSVTCVEEELPLESENFCWVNSKQLRQALLSDYAVNTDARSVITSAPWRLVAAGKEPFSGDNRPGSFRELCRKSYSTAAKAAVAEKAASLLARERERFGLEAHKCALEALPNWTLSGAGVDSTKPGADFCVRYYAVDAPEREVAFWDQPLVQSLNVGEVMFLCQMRAGVLRFFLSFSYEVGLTGGVEFGPSYQSESWSRYMRALKAFLDTKQLEPQLTVLQSDEGGRFMQSRTRYSILCLSEAEDVPALGNGLWVTLAEVEQLCRAPKLLTNEARSCVSLLLGMA